MKNFLLSLILSVFGATVLAAVNVPFVPAFCVGMGLNVVTSFVPAVRNVAALRLFTAPGGVGVAFQFNLTYIPEFLFYNHAGAQLTQLRVETQEDGVLLDLPAAGLTAMNGFQKIGAQVTNDCFLRLADGHIPGRNVTISGITAAVGAINIFGCSDNIGVAPMKSYTAQILALQPTKFTKFSALVIPTMATATDYVQVKFSDGHSQRFEIEDLQTLSSFYNQVQGIILNNTMSYIQEAEFVCAAATPVYVLNVKI